MSLNGYSTSEDRFIAILEQGTKQQPKPYKPKEAWRILYNGKVFQTPGSRKSVWSAIGHAKSALRNSLASHYEDSKNYDHFITQAMELGIIKFERLDLK